MKKLMTMIAAVGMAFGLFAATDLPSSTSFESTSEFTDGKLIIGDGTKWTCADDAATLSQTKYEDSEAYPYSGTARYAAFGSDQGKYLTIKTAFDKPLNRSFTEAAAADKAPVFIDQLVKFTAADEDMEIADADAKIGVWAREIYAADGETVTGTNLFVTAGPVVNSKATIYDLGTIDVEAWHRLTIKAIKAKNSELGYEIFLDGIALEADKAGYASTEGLSIEAQALNIAKKIFPAMVGGLEVASLGIAGQGAIDDMMTTMTSPGTWADTKSITLDFEDSKVTKLVYTAFGEETSVERTTATSVTLPYITGMTLFINMEDTECEDAYQVESVESGGGASLNKTTGAIIGLIADDVIYIKTKDYAQRIKIGNVYYANFADAIAALPTSGSASMQLQEDVNVGTQMISESEATEAFFNKGCAVTIDLAGNKIIGTAEEFAGYVIQSVDPLTIIDTEGGGSVETAADTDYAGVVKVKSGVALTVTGGTFEGNIDADSAEGTGGKFLKGSQAACPVVPADGYKLSDDGTYWTIVAKTKYTISVTGAANATVKINDQDVKSIELTEGAAYSIVVTPNANYEYKEGAAYGDFIWTEGTLTKSGTATDTAAFAAANATAIEWGITYMDDETELTALAGTYTIENRDQVTLAEGPKKDGYNFDAWYWDDGFQTKAAAADFATKTGNQVLYAKYVAKTYTITAVSGSANPETYTIDDVAGDEGLSVELEANEPETGKKFKEWTIVTDPTGADVTIDDTTASVAVMKIAKGVLANITVEATYEDVGPDLPPWVPQTEKEAYDDWKAGPGKTESDFKGDDAEIAKKMEDSFLLDCEPTEAALKTAKENFKITSITKDSEGNWVVLTADKEGGEKYGNGLIKLEAFESVGCDGTPVKPADQSQLFWKASLVHPTAN